MYVCMYVWLCWVFISVRGLSLVVASGGHSSSRCGGHSSSRCAGLSLSQPLVAEHRLQTHRLSNCGSRAELLRGMWDLPRPGLEPASPALAGRFSTTVPPGKPSIKYFECTIMWAHRVWDICSELESAQDFNFNQSQSSPWLGSPSVLQQQRQCSYSQRFCFILFSSYKSTVARMKT